MSITRGELGIVLVIDDDPADRDRTATVLREAGFRTRVATGAEGALVTTSTDGEEAPAAIVLDVSLDGITGYEVCRRLREAHGDEMAIIFVSGVRTEPIDRVAGLLLGADDYLAKPFLPDELIARVLGLVRRIGRRSARMNRTANGARGASGHGANGNRPTDNAMGGRPYQLTERELEVLRLLADGLDQAEVARALFVSKTTVATHIQRILGKLAVHNRAQAVALAHREGLVMQATARRRAN